MLVSYKKFLVTVDQTFRLAFLTEVTPVTKLLETPEIVCHLHIYFVTEQRPYLYNSHNSYGTVQTLLHKKTSIDLNLMLFTNVA